MSAAELPKPPQPKQTVQKVNAPSAPTIELEPNTYKILSDKNTGAYVVLVRLGDGEYAKGVRVFGDYLIVDTSERNLRVELAPLTNVKSVEKCTTWLPYVNLQLKL